MDTGISRQSMLSTFGYKDSSKSKSMRYLRRKVDVVSREVQRCPAQLTGQSLFGYDSLAVAIVLHDATSKSQVHSANIGNHGLRESRRFRATACARVEGRAPGIVEQLLSRSLRAYQRSCYDWLVARGSGLKLRSCFQPRRSRRLCGLQSRSTTTRSAPFPSLNNRSVLLHAMTISCYWLNRNPECVTRNENHSAHPRKFPIEVRAAPIRLLARNCCPLSSTVSWPSLRGNDHHCLSFYSGD